jgi:phosphatidylinositol glycan class B
MLNFTYIQKVKLVIRLQNSFIPGFMKFERTVFLSAMLIYAISAWFSTGFYHGDEHFQIIEFACHKMGSVSQDQLAWEFESRVRPAIQPFVAFVVIRFLNLFALSDPYVQTFILRLLTAFFSLFSIRYFTFACRDMVRAEYRRAYLLLSYFLWFLLFVNVRFSSETWSGLLLLNSLSVQLIDDRERRKFWIIGGLLGLSFLFRYQNAFLAMGLILWLIIIQREKAVNMLKLSLSGLAVLLLGIVLDFWLYGEPVLSWWNYFYVNLVEGVASGYGTEAWWNYFYSIFRFGFFPISIPVILAFLLLLVKKPRNIFIWTIVPFFIIHCIIPHKELRFLFPVVNMVPVILVLAWQELNLDLDKWRKPGRVLLRATAWILVAINCIAVITVILKPADGGLMTITRYIRYHYGEQPIRLISYDHSNPYGPWGLMSTFYMEKDMQDIRLGSLEELGDDILDTDRLNLLVLKKQHAETDTARTYVSGHNGIKTVQSIPEWMEPLMTLYGGFHLEWILELYEFPEAQP